MSNIGRIGVIGPGIVGVPMAALLARAAKAGHYGPDAHVMVVQRDSPTSGWKVGAINRGESPIGGIEPGLEDIIGDCVGTGHLKASHDYGDLTAADVVLVCVQTDKMGLQPDYRPMYGALDALGEALAARKDRAEPTLISIESTLAPSSMQSVIREKLAEHGVIEGRDVLLGNSPNRVMPGRLVERVAHADKLAGGLDPRTPKRIAALYEPIVTQGTVYTTNSLTAEVVKTLENTYRDVRIAYAAELVRYCDDHDVDFFALREAMNAKLADADDASYDAAAVPSGALLVPGVGVGGHCLPKDGILLRWRMNQKEPGSIDRSLIHAARRINDASPAWAAGLAERAFGELDGKKVALLGLAYRADSDDTRNGPTFQLADHLLAKGCEVTVHDPYVRKTDANLNASPVAQRFTHDLDEALAGAAVVIMCQPHKPYRDGGPALFAGRAGLLGVCDAANVWKAGAFAEGPVGYTGVGRGTQAPSDDLVAAALSGFRAVEVGFANELAAVVEDLNARYAGSDFQRIDLDEVRRLAATCATGCDVVAPGEVPAMEPGIEGLDPELVRLAHAG
jgi:UDP-N-acetyl-D-mannosaminuronic acid dehydrogenase